MQDEGKSTSTHPNKLYRYRKSSTQFALDEILEAVNYRRIFFSAAANLNDPFDFRPVYKANTIQEVSADLKRTHGHKKILSRERVSELMNRPVDRKEYRILTRKGKAGPDAAKLELQAAKKVFQALPKDSQIACLSDTISNIPMWAHYSEDHSGYCFEYEVVRENWNRHEPFPLEVRYSKHRPQITTLDLRTFTARSQYESKDLSEKVFDALFFTKSDQWAYEREWRVLKKGKIGGYAKINCLKVRSIIFGVRAPMDFVQSVQTQLGDRVLLQQAQPSVESFSMSLNRL